MTEEIGSINDSLKRQLEALGVSIEEEEVIQESNSKAAKEEAKLILPMVRAWLGGTVLRELFIAKQREEIKKIPISINHFAEQLTSVQSATYYTKVFVNKMAKGDEKKLQAALDGLEHIKKLVEDGNTISAWSLIRAMNRAVSLSNYGNYMQRRGWIYTGDSDHKIITTMLTGEYRWTEPQVFTFSTVPAETEEDYLKPYYLQDIPNPDNPDEMVKIRVYRRAGNTIHPSSNYTDGELLENDPLVKALQGLAPGECFRKPYDNELHVSEFERQAESDVDFVLDKAQEMGIRIWPMINSEKKEVTLYHAGAQDEPGVATG